jgi:hypothetical protein
VDVCGGCGPTSQGAKSASPRAFHPRCLVQAAGYIPGDTCRYIQCAGGKVYFYAGGNESGEGGLETWRLDPLEQMPVHVQGRQRTVRESINRIKARSSARGQKPAASGLRDSREFIQDVMTDNLEAVNERGEKISQLQDDSEKLAAQSSRFADNARKLRAKAEADRSKGVFGGLFG